MKKGAAVAAGIASMPLLLLGIIIGGSDESAALCPPGGGTGPVSLQVDASSIPAGTSVAGYGPEQLANAAAIVEAGKALGVSSREQTIGVMTAMGESSLKVIDYGDAAGPDSRGLFQQRANGAWGSYEDRMDPFTSATNFFRAMQNVADRDTLEPTLVAHRTQRNADPYHYVKYWEPAVQVVAYLTGEGASTVPATSVATCQVGTGTPGAVNAQGWAVPAAGPITSPFGMRWGRLHAGTDLAGGSCGGPIWAAQTGTVTFQGFDSGGNGTIRVDHGGGLSTEYLHMFVDGMFVREGDQVAAGQQIAAVGNSGGSTGCHLHFVVKQNGTATDPEPFMRSVGVTLG